MSLKSLVYVKYRQSKCSQKIWSLLRTEQARPTPPGRGNVSRSRLIGWRVEASRKLHPSQHAHTRAAPEPWNNKVSLSSGNKTELGYETQKYLTCFFGGLFFSLTVELSQIKWAWRGLPSLPGGFPGIFFRFEELIFIFVYFPLEHHKTWPVSPAVSKKRQFNKIIDLYLLPQFRQFQTDTY